MKVKAKVRRRFGLVLIIAGLLLIISSAVLVAYNFYTDSKAAEGIDEILSQLPNEVEVEQSSQSQPDYISNPYMEMPIKTINGIDYIGRLSIPNVDLELPIIHECTYPNLRIAPCRYNGSVYLDNMVIAGHNYSSTFGKIKQVSVGDSVVFTDIDGNVFNYEVVDMQILFPTAVENMIVGDWDLTLFTCTVGGRTRFTVRCDRVDIS